MTVAAGCRELMGYVLPDSRALRGLQNRIVELRAGFPELGGLQIALGQGLFFLYRSLSLSLSLFIIIIHIYIYIYTHIYIYIYYVLFTCLFMDMGTCRVRKF